MILISLAVVTIISMAVMALILMVYGNKQEEIYQPIQIKTNNKLLSNEKISKIIPPKKNYKFYHKVTHISIIIPYSNSIINKLGNILKIEGPYNLNCNETRMFGYTDKFTIW
jgi:hypothetical protein